MNITRIYLYTLGFLGVGLIAGCDSDKGLNCFQAAGDSIEQVVEVASFTEIVVEERIQLIVKQGTQQQVVVRTGENLLNDIEVRVNEGVLTLFNNNGCNLVRDYNISQIIVTVPDLKSIRNASGYEVQSEGVLDFTSLSLISEDIAEEDGFHKDGDFRLQLDVDELSITANGLSNYFLSGMVDEAYLEILEGDARFEGRDLFVQDLTVYHRGTNKVIVNPTESIRGQVLSTGDLIVVNRPAVVEVDELYTGKIIFE